MDGPEERQVTREFAHAFVAQNGPLMTEALETIIGKRPETPDDPRPLGVAESEAKRRGEGTGAYKSVTLENGPTVSDSPSMQTSGPAPIPASIIQPLLVRSYQARHDDPPSRLTEHAIASLAVQYPDAVALRRFEFMGRGWRQSAEVVVRCLHLEQWKVGFRGLGPAVVCDDVAPSLVVIPLDNAEWLGRCEACREHPALGDACICKGTKRTVRTFPALTSFIDAGDRQTGGWRLLPLAAVEG
jgi:hypothetical protein